MKKKLQGLTRRSKAAIAGCLVLSALLISGTIAVQDARQAVEIASSHVDPVLETEIVSDETPLASAPKVTTKTTKKTATTKKNVSLKKAASKTYSKTLPSKTQKTTKTVKKNTSTTVKTDTTVLTQTYEKYTKKSKVKVVTTKKTTTVKTTTTVKPVAAAAKKPYELQVAKAAPKMDSKVISAYQTLGLEVWVDSSVSYAGYFDAKNKKITLKADDDTIYHELGHFLGFISGNYDVSSEFVAIYQAEKDNYTGYNKTYVVQNSAEYFAESVKDYMLNKSALKSARPKTYDAVEKALSKVTTAQVNKMKLILSLY